MRTVIGIDPGQTGAVAFIDQYGALVEDCPDSPAAMADMIRIRMPNIQHAFLERVHSMPGQGVSSTFKFGTNFGIWQGILGALHIPMTFITPQEWKKHWKLIGTDKDDARILACQQFPSLACDMQRKKDIGRADALLIAAYGATLNYVGKHQAVA